MNCQNCNKHKGTENWVGNGNMMSYVHGDYQIWCKCCCLQAQMKNAEEVIKNYERLKKKLYKINCK